jgi:cytidylate kinase
VAASDAARADYLKRFYKLGAEVPTIYDLVLNTDRITAEEAAGLVVQAVKR